jgi:hypothetical protein
MFFLTPSEGNTPEYLAGMCACARATAENRAAPTANNKGLRIVYLLK